MLAGNPDVTWFAAGPERNAVGVLWVLEPSRITSDPAQLRQDIAGWAENDRGVSLLGLCKTEQFTCIGMGFPEIVSLQV